MSEYPSQADIENMYFWNWFNGLADEMNNNRQYWNGDKLQAALDHYREHCKARAIAGQNKAGGE